MSMSEGIRVDIANMKTMLMSIDGAISLNIDTVDIYLNTLSMVSVASGHESPATIAASLSQTKDRLINFRTKMGPLADSVSVLEKSFSEENALGSMELMMQITQQFGTIQAEFGDIRQALTIAQNSVERVIQSQGDPHAEVRQL